MLLAGDAVRPHWLNVSAFNMHLVLVLVSLVLPFCLLDIFNEGFLLLAFYLYVFYKKKTHGLLPF